MRCAQEGEGCPYKLVSSAREPMHKEGKLSRWRWERSAVLWHEEWSCGGLVQTRGTQVGGGWCAGAGLRRGCCWMLGAGHIRRI